MSKDMILSELDMVGRLFGLTSNKHPGRNYHGKSAVMYRTRNGVQAAIGEAEYIQEVIRKSGKGIFYLIPADEDALLTDEVRAAFRELNIQ